MFSRRLHSLALVTAMLLAATTTRVAAAGPVAAPITEAPDDPAMAADTAGAETDSPIVIAAARSDASQTTYQKRFTRTLSAAGRPCIQLYVDVTWTVDKQTRRQTSLTVAADGKAFRPESSFNGISRKQLGGKPGDRARRIDVVGSFSYRNPRTGATRPYALRVNKQIGENGNTY